MIDYNDMLELKRWNTPTIYNGLEAVTKHDLSKECYNIEETRDFMPQMGPMVGRAVTVVFEPSDSAHKTENPNAWAEYREYIASVPGPKIVIVQDLDKPRAVGAFWGEVNSNVHKALGCVGTITDGAVRDVDEMCNAGFKAIARCMCVGHAFSTPVKWNCEVEVFGRKIKPGQLIHADKHGFLVIPEEDEEKVLEAARFMDSNECQTTIKTARSSAGLDKAEILENLKKADKKFGENVKAKFGTSGEW